MSYYHAGTIKFLLDSLENGVELTGGLDEYSRPYLQALLKAEQTDVYAVCAKTVADDMPIGVQIIESDQHYRVKIIRVSTWAYISDVAPRLVAHIWPEVLAIPYENWYYELIGNDENIYNIHDNKIHYPSLMEFLKG